MASSELAAWLKGYRSGLESSWTAVHYVAEADRMLELCRVSPQDRRVIWQQAGDDARAEHPDLPPQLLRALAARRITLLLAERVSELLPAQSYPQAAE